MKYLLVILFVVAGLFFMNNDDALASSKREEALHLIREAQMRTIGEKYVAYGNVICLIEQGHKHKAGEALNALMADEADSAMLDMVSDAYFVLKLNPKPKSGGTYTNISGFVYEVSSSGNEKKAGGTVYFWNYLRTILLYKFPATASAGYYGRIWVQRYDCRGRVTSSGKYSAWRNDYLPAYPSAILNFYIYQ
ncbi:MAG: hypothetical protein L6Q29_02665 [Candidatus Pacebacteria bacterium]|nr:hypothetical protein [Candidatus Paceibacterota bacterium]NUQ56901.1 hypothetical protein [Candidatus Paceibacter sp.]